MSTQSKQPPQPTARNFFLVRREAANKKASEARQNPNPNFHEGQRGPSVAQLGFIAEVWGTLHNACHPDTAWPDTDQQKFFDKYVVEVGCIINSEQRLAMTLSLVSALLLLTSISQQERAAA